MKQLIEFAYNSIPTESTWIRKKDNRKYKVVTKARSRVHEDKDWVILNIICKPLDGDYCNYVIPVEEFVRDFKEI